MAPLPPGVDRGATPAAARAGGRRAAPGRGRRRKRAAAQVAARRGSGCRRRRGCGRRFVLGVRGQLQRWCRKPAPDRPVDRPGHLDRSGQSDRLWLRGQPVGRRRNTLGAGRRRRPDDRGPRARQRRPSPHVPPAPRRGRLRDRVGGGLGRPERHRAQRAERRGADRAGRSPRRAERAPRGDHPPARRPRQRLDRRRRWSRLGARGRRNADSDRSRHEQGHGPFRQRRDRDVDSHPGRRVRLDLRVRGPRGASNRSTDAHHEDIPLHTAAVASRLGRRAEQADALAARRAARHDHATRPELRSSRPAARSRRKPDRGGARPRQHLGRCREGGRPRRPRERGAHDRPAAEGHARHRDCGRPVDRHHLGRQQPQRARQ